MIIFFVPGTPVPKQSFRYAKGGGYTPKRVKDWNDTVYLHSVMEMRGMSPLTGKLEATLDFYLPTNRRVDLDNLSKNVLDAMNDSVYLDDKQIVKLVLTKTVVNCKIGTPGVRITVGETI